MRENRLTHVVTVKVDAATARALAAVENRSEFVRDAIADRLALRCPLCAGTGYVGPTQGHEVATLLGRRWLGACVHCGQPVYDAGCDADGHDHPRLTERLGQARAGGPVYCQDCFQPARPCHECSFAWRPEDEALHRRFRQ